VPKEEFDKANESENYLRTMVTQLDHQLKAQVTRNEILEKQVNDINEGIIITKQVQGK